MIYVEQFYKFLYSFFNSQLFKKFHFPAYFMYSKHSWDLHGAWNSSVYYRILGKKPQKNQNLVFTKWVNIFLINRRFSSTLYPNVEQKWEV